MRWPDAPSPPPSLLSVNVVIQHVNVRYVRYVLYVMYNAVSRVSCMPRLFLTFPCQRKFKIAYLESVWLSKRRPCIRFCRIRSTLLDETSVGMCKVLRGGMPVDVLESLVTNRLTEFLTVVCSGTLSSAPAFRSTTCPSCSVSACIVGASIPYGPAYLIHTAPCTGCLVRHRPAVWKLDEHRHTGHAAPFVRLLAQTSISSGRSVHRRGWLICHGHHDAPKYISATLQPLLGYVPLHATSTAESEFS